MQVIVDGPSAWLVVAGGFLMQFVIIGYLKSTGLLMREFQAYFRCSNTLILLITSIKFSLINILAPGFSLLSSRIPLRWIVVSSSLLICLSMCLLYSVFSLTVWIICVGLCIGASLSACYSSVICKVNECFERRRDLANGICFAGSSAGAVVMPLLFTFLTDRYSVTGCSLLTGGYFLHLVIVGLLMPTAVRPADTGGEGIDGGREPQTAESAAVATADANRRRASDVYSLGSQQSNSGLGEQQQQQQKQKAGKKNSLAGRLASLSMGQRWRALIYMLATIMSNFGFVSQYVMYPMYLGECSVPTSTTAVLVAFNGLSDLIARIIVGYLSDRYQWRRSYIAATGMTSLGLMCLLIAFCTSQLKTDSDRLVLFIVYAVLGGISGGIYMGIITSVLVGFVGVPNLSFIHSVVCCSWSLLVFPGQTLLGYIKDQTRTFKYSFVVLGLVMQCASVTLLLERLVKEDKTVVSDNDARTKQDDFKHGEDPAIRDALIDNGTTAERTPETQGGKSEQLQP